MTVSVTMPALGESVSEGTVTRWLKKEGDKVEADEPLLEVSTDKVDTEIPSPAAGVLKTIKVAEDETVEVGAELAVIDEGGEAAAEEKPQQEAEEPEPEAAAETEEEPEEEPKPEPEPEPEPEEPTAQEGGDGQASGSSYATPLVRRLASEQGVDLASVTGSGVGGRIRKQDVLEAAKAPASEKPAAKQQPAAERPAAAKPAASKPAAGRTEPLSRLRRVIAERMTESLHISAQLTTVLEADLTRIARLRQRVKDDFEQREGVRLSFLPFFALATVEALREFPQLNASLDMDAGTITYHDAVHLGIAVDTERGLLVPVIHDASDLNLAGLARKIADLAERTRASKVNPDELGGGTFTLTNTGSRGALFDTPIINQPQVGILGTGSVVKRPVIVEDEYGADAVAVRHMCYLSLTYDHRLVDGADAARFLTHIKQRLEDGAFEAECGL